MKSRRTRHAPGGPWKTRSIVLQFRGKRRWPGFIIAATWLILVRSPAIAADRDAGPPASSGAFGAGGLMWWLLLGLSFVAMAIVFDSILTVRYGRMAPSPTAEALTEAVRARSLDNACRLREDPAHGSFLTSMVLAGVQFVRDHPEATADEVGMAARDAGEASARRLYWRIDALAAFGAVAPLVGLLGTSLALVASLGRIAASGDAARAADISAAAGQALGTTVLGLLIAVPSLVAANLLRARLDILTHEVARLAENILRPLGRR